jgi:hypothetical protein
VTYENEMLSAYVRRLGAKTAAPKAKAPARTRATRRKATTVRGSGKKKR